VFCRVAGQISHSFGDVFGAAGMAERDSLGGGFPFGVGVIGSDARGGDASRATALTRTLSGASLSASDLVRPRMQALAAASQVYNPY